MPERGAAGAGSWLRRIQLPLMLLTLAALAWLLARDFRGEEFQRVFSQASVSWLGMALLPSVSALLLKGLRLCYLGKGMGFSLSLWQGLKYQTIAISLASLTPGRAGEFSKVFLLAGGDKSRLTLATLTVVLERVFDLLALGLLALTFCLVQLHNQSLSLALALMLAGLLLLAGILIRLGSRDIGRLRRYLPERFHFLLGQMPALPWYRLVVQALLTLLVWFCEGLSQWLILKAAGFEVPLLPVLGINALVAIASILSLLPVGLGTMDLSALVLYGSSLHVPQAGVLFLIAAARLINLAPLLALFTGIVLSDRPLLAQLRAAQKAKKAAAGS